MTESGAKGLDLRVRARSSASTLVVDYSAVNPTGGALFLCCLLEDYYGLTEDEGLSSSLGQVLADGNDRVLVYVGTVRPPNKLGGIRRTPRVPFARKIADGEPIEGRLLLPLPLLEWHAYMEPRVSPTDRTQVSQVRLVVEFLREESLNLVRRHPSIPDAFAVHGAPYEYLTGTADIEGPSCDLRVRTDAIFRPEV